MATYSVVRNKTATLSGATVDTVNLIQTWDYVEVSNSGTTPIYITMNGTLTPTIAGDNCEVVEAGVTKLFRATKPGGFVNGTNNHPIQLIGAGNGYTVSGASVSEVGG